MTEPVTYVISEWRLCDGEVYHRFWDKVGWSNDHRKLDCWKTSRGAFRAALRLTEGPRAIDAERMHVRTVGAAAAVALRPPTTVQARLDKLIIAYLCDQVKYLASRIDTLEEDSHDHKPHICC